MSRPLQDLIYWGNGMRGSSSFAPPYPIPAYPTLLNPQPTLHYTNPTPPFPTSPYPTPPHLSLPHPTPLLHPTSPTPPHLTPGIADSQPPVGLTAVFHVVVSVHDGLRPSTSIENRCFIFIFCFCPYCPVFLGVVSL